MLKWPKKIIVISWYLLMILLGAGIAVYNPDIVKVKVFEYEIANTSLGIVLCLVLALGGFLGFFTAQIKVWQQKRKTRKAEKEVAKLKKVEQAQPAEALPSHTANTVPASQNSTAPAKA